MLVCGCPASQGGILRARSPAGRRVRASAPVYGRKSPDVYINFVHTCAPFSSLRFRRLLGLSHSYFYNVSAPAATRRSKSDLFSLPSSMLASLELRAGLRPPALREPRRFHARCHTQYTVHYSTYINHDNDTWAIDRIAAVRDSSYTQ